MSKYFFKDLIVLDLANNHFGNISHAKKIITQFGKINSKYKLNASIKFQFRQLPEFVHFDYRNSDEKYVRRFLDTRISDNSYYQLFKFIKKKNFKTSCTPFDESSISKIEKFGFDILKIASVSAQDFSLHERASKNKIPKIISTGGLKIEEIDKIVSFYSKKSQKFALMHCVSIYPSNNKSLNINFISNLKKRYDDVPIGWSTHERPDEFLPAVLALSKGASIFEKHIGIKSKKFKLNDYSITPEIFEKWYINLKKSKIILGNYEKKIFPQEIKTIKNLSRGVYAKQNIKPGEVLDKTNIYFAIPLKNGQLASQDLKKGTTSKMFIKKDHIIKKNLVNFDEHLILEHKVKSYLHKAKAMLNYNNVKVGQKFDLEISHHKGIQNFEKVGCFLFNVINREYAKKILLMLPNQKHPSHFHQKKKETFIVIAGRLKVKDGKKIFYLEEGDMLHLGKSSWHSFEAGKEGCIFEELSTTSYKDDSFYKNKNIKKLNRDMRKTYVKNWFSVNTGKLKILN